MSGDVRDPRLFDHDPLTGLTEYFIFNPETEGFTIQTVQENESEILELNAEIRKDNTGRYKDLTHVAHIPAVVFAQLQRDGIQQDPKRMKKWLNDPDNRCFRVREGRV